MKKQIALLATGNELINGDVLNTNSQYIAQQLIDHDIQPGMHMIVSDEEADITEAFHFLLQKHAVVICVGGLGPTSDDRTRYALSQAISKKLVYDDASWDRIVERLTRKNLPIPESNRQQCYFPEGAVIIPNPNGTASACMVEYNKRLIILLPGPPNECRPIFNDMILFHLLSMNSLLEQKIFRRSWLLLGVSEGSIAQQLDPLVQDKTASIGYRVHYPHLEVKLESEEKNVEFENLCGKIQSTIESNLISTKRETAAEQLVHFFELKKESLPLLLISDEATLGLLEYQLMTPTLFNTIQFKTWANENQEEIMNKENIIRIHISGLLDYWQQTDSVQSTALTIKIQTNKKERLIEKQIPYRIAQTRALATEIICWELLKFFNKHSW